jgi:hypothetical protein
MGWDVGGGFNTNAGIIGGPVEADGQDHFATVEDYNTATAATDTKIEHALNPFNWGIPWYFWAGLGIVGVLAILHELNPTLELLHDVVKSK